MEENNIKDVPYIVYESAQSRHERTVKRLIIVIILTICMLFASNAIWLYAWTQYDYVDGEVQEVTFDSGDNGTNNFIGRDMNGAINNGDNDSQNLQGQDKGETHE